MSHPPEERDDLLRVVSDEYAQAILAATSSNPMSAKELSETLDIDRSTVYRRVDEMLEYDMLVEGTRIVEDGSHHSVYEANVEHVDIEVDDGEIEVNVQVGESAAERFTRIWDDIREV